MNWLMILLGDGGAAVVLVVAEQVARRLYLRRLSHRDRFAWRRFFS